MPLSKNSARKFYYSHTSFNERKNRESSKAPITNDPFQYKEKFPTLRMKGVDDPLPSDVTIECDRWDHDSILEFENKANKNNISITEQMEKEGYYDDEIDAGGCSISKNGKLCGGSEWTMNWENKTIQYLNINVYNECRKQHLGSYLMRNVVNHADELKLDIKKIQSVPQDKHSPSKNQLIAFYSSFGDPKKVNIVDGFVNRKHHS